VAVELFLYS